MSGMPDKAKPHKGGNRMSDHTLLIIVAIVLLIIVVTGARR